MRYWPSIEEVKKKGLSNFAKVGLATLAAVTLFGLGTLVRREPEPVPVPVEVVVTATPMNTPIATQPPKTSPINTLAPTSTPVSTNTPMPTPTYTPTAVPYVATQDPETKAIFERIRKARGTPLPDEVMDLIVYADEKWQIYPMIVNVGDLLEIGASGLWSHGNEGVCCGPNTFDGDGYHDKYDSSSYMPQERVGSLIGRIGDCEPFFIGRYNKIRAQCSGNLYLSMNDVSWSFIDNSGQLNVAVQKYGG